MKYFFDNHFHVMTLNHPNLVSFINYMQTDLPDFLTSGILSPSYIIKPGARNTLSDITNTLEVFDRPIGDTLLVMEQDLMGRYDDDDVKFIRDGKFHFRDMVFDKMGMCPQVMDFTITKDARIDGHYPSSRRDRLITYVEDTIEGIDYYRRYSETGMFEFFPFLGMNPYAHDMETMEHILHHYVDTGHSREGRKLFRGIKIYPPLDFNPVPDKNDPSYRKVHRLFDFCEENSIPIVTHCDDQGFRVIDSRHAWKYSAPRTWSKVLKEHPHIKIDFAHFGKQYNSLIKLSSNPLRPIKLRKTSSPSSPWFYDIVSLMEQYEGVYADFSFSGANPQWYEQVRNFLENNQDIADLVISRILFGTDFSVNLTKVKSYNSYYQLFEKSPFTDDEIDRFVNINPFRFLGMEHP